MLNKKLIFLILFIEASFLYATPEKKYKTLFTNKIEQAQNIIETEIFGKTEYSSKLVLSSVKGGTYFDYYFYAVDDDNICLGIKSFSELQDDAVIYINTQKECGTTCKVYLDEPKEKQIFYVWEPFKEVTSDSTKEKITIKTDKGIYSIYIRKGITELELFFEGFPKIKSIKGLENFPELINLSFNGINTYRAVSLWKNGLMAMDYIPSLKEKAEPLR